MLGRGISATRSGPSSSRATRPTSSVKPASLSTDGMPSKLHSSSRVPVTCRSPRPSADVGDRPLAHFRVQRAHRAFEHHFLGNHVRILSAVNLAERHDDRVLAVGRPGNELIERADELGRGRDRIVRFVRPRRVAAATVNRDSHHVAAGGEHAGPDADVPARRVGSTCSETIASTSSTAPAPIIAQAAVARFLGRLENARHVTGQGRAPSRSSPSSADSAPNTVAVCTSCPQACITSRHGAAIRHLLLVLNSQRIDIGPHRDPPRRLLVAAFDDHAAPFGPHPHRQTPLGEKLVQLQAGLQLLAARLGVHVQMPPQRDQAAHALSSIAASSSCLPREVMLNYSSTN